MPNEPFILEGTSANFATLVLENSRKGPVLVDFWADWAGPSLRQGELLRRLARDYGGRFLLVSLNTDREKEVAQRYGVKALPSCKLFRRGKVVEEIHGMQTESDYRTIIDRHLRPLADRAQAAALAAWEAGDPERAIQVLAEAAMAEPDNPAVPLLLAKLLVRQERHRDAHAVLAALPPALRAGGEIRRLYTHLTLIMTAMEGGNAGNARPDALLQSGHVPHPWGPGAVPGKAAMEGGNAGNARPDALLQSGHVPHPWGPGAVPGKAAMEGGNAGNARPDALLQSGPVADHSGTAADPNAAVQETAAATPAPVPDPMELFALGARCVVGDDYAAALVHFAELERHAPGYRDGLGRDALLLVMELLGPDDEQVRRYRRSLFEH